MTEEIKNDIKGYLLAAFLSMQQISDRTGVTLQDVKDVMMSLSEDDLYNDDY